MTAVLIQPSVASPPVAHLHVRRTDIDFQNIAEDRVRITVNVLNVGDARSEETTMRLQAAALGAFLPWQDIGSVVVPSIPPLQRTQVTLEVAAPIPRKLGDNFRVPPRDLITALAAAEPPDNRVAEKLPDDPLALMGRGTQWAGNINVLIGKTAVERHMARALRVYPGRINSAVFFVGYGPNQYQFDFAGSAASWQAVLREFPKREKWYHEIPSEIIPLNTWIWMHRRVVLLAIRPPARAEQGVLEVHVRERSTGREAVVEFSLDPNAAGPGCYTV